MTANSYAQPAEPVKKLHKIGFNYGYGSQFGLNVNYGYKAHLFQIQYYYPLTTGRIYAVEVVSQPQYNLTTFKNTSISKLYRKGHEMGLNIGVLARKNILKGSGSFYFLVSSGPHYVSRTPSRQAKGFIFSDNFLCGLSIKTGNKTYFDVRNGIRHISNASLKQPNSGVNNFVVNIGFYIAVNRNIS